MEYKKKKIVAIVQARMGSTRLPGKMIMRIGDKTLIQHIVDRLKKVKLIDQIIIATSNLKKDNPMIEFSKKAGVDFFAGDEKDVLKRFYDAAKKYHADVIVRISGDEPFIDFGLINEGIKIHLENSVDYTSTIINRKIIEGLDFEVFNFEVLERINMLDKERSSREHVTAYILKHPKLFKMLACDFEEKYWVHNISLCVDTAEDLKRLQEMYSKLSKKNMFFTAKEIVDLTS